MTTIVGHGAASFFTICIIAVLLLSMTSSTADAGRALFGISRAGMTIKAFGVLIRFHVPARAMTMDLVVNIVLVMLIKSNLAILYISNIGYVLAHVFALSAASCCCAATGPNWPRPIKVGAGWLPIAAFLCVLNAAFLVVGALAPKLNGYGTWTDFCDRRRRSWSARCCCSCSGGWSRTARACICARTCRWSPTQAEMQALTGSPVPVASGVTRR